MTRPNHDGRLVVRVDGGYQGGGKRACRLVHVGQLEVMDEETDEAAHFWGHLYACDSDDDEDEVDDEACSPEEAQLLLYLGHSLHDYLGDAPAEVPKEIRKALQEAGSTHAP